MFSGSRSRQRTPSAFFEIGNLNSSPRRKYRAFSAGKMAKEFETILTIKE
jgi:hypothetical protein